MHSAGDANVSKDRWLYVAISLSALFFIIFSYYSILRYQSLNATGFDLGIYSSALNNAIHGGLFYTNLLNESYLGNHFSPFMFVLVPFFYIYQHNATLLVLQAFFISFGAVPLYLTYRKVVLNDEYRKYSLFLILLYELSPISTGPVSFDFHLMALMPFFYLFALYFFISRRYVSFYLSIGIIVSLHAFFAIIVVFFIFSLYIVRYVKRGWIKEIMKRKGSTVRVICGFILSVTIPIVYLIFAEQLKSVISGSSFSITGIGSLLIYLKNEYNISFTLNMLLLNHVAKIDLLAITLLGGGFLALLSPLVLIPIIPYILFSMFSGNSAYYMAGYQYTAMFSPMIFAGSVYGIKKVVRKLKSAKYSGPGVKMVIVVFVLLICLVNFALSPITPEPVHVQNSNITSISDFHVNRTSEALFLIRDNISTSSLILTQNNLYPQFSKFPDAYLLYSYTSVGDLSNLMSRNFTYVIADRYSFNYNHTDLVGVSMRGLVEKLSSSNYGFYFDEFGIIVLKYEYSGPQLMMVNGSLVYG